MDQGAWERRAALMSVIVNCQRMPSQQLSPDHFNPYRQQGHISRGIRLTTKNIHLLKVLLK